MHIWEFTESYILQMSKHSYKLRLYSESPVAITQFQQGSASSSWSVLWLCPSTHFPFSWLFWSQFKASYHFIYKYPICTLKNMEPFKNINAQSYHT